MQLNQLRYLLEVARTQNISAAAENLYVSQPALSQQIQKLEQELGIPLLVRHPKSVTLTDAGEEFVLHAERIVNATDQLSERMRKHSQLLAGTLRIGMTSICGYVGLYHLLARFREAMPGINYRLSIDITGRLLEMLKKRQLHAAFIISTDQNMEKREGELYYKQLQQNKYVAMVPETNPLSRKPVLDMSDFSGQNLIMPSQDSILSQQLKVYFDSNGVEPNILCENSQTDIGLQLTSEGLGIAFVSENIARDNCPPGVCLVPFEPKIYRMIYYVTLRDLLDYPSVRSFSSYVEHYVF